MQTLFSRFTIDGFPPGPTFICYFLFWVTWRYDNVVVLTCQWYVWFVHGRQWCHCGYEFCQYSYSWLVSVVWYSIKITGASKVVYWKFVFGSCSELQMWCQIPNVRAASSCFVLSSYCFGRILPNFLVVYIQKFRYCPRYYAWSLLLWWILSR